LNNGWGAKTKKNTGNEKKNDNVSNKTQFLCELSFESSFFFFILIVGVKHLGRNVPNVKKKVYFCRSFRQLLLWTKSFFFCYEQKKKASNDKEKKILKSRHLNKLSLSFV